jgi:hypothetical protein
MYYCEFSMVGPRKVRLSREGVAMFNGTWPGSRLTRERAYWWEFDAEGDLIDSDAPACDDGPELVALSEDAWAWMDANTD